MSKGFVPPLFYPGFSRLKKAVLELYGIPDEPLPPQFESGVQELAAFQTSPWSHRSLWWGCLAIIQPFLWRGVLASLGASVAGLCAAFSGMEVIRQGQSYERGALFACLFFASNFSWLLGSYFLDLMRRYASVGLMSRMSALVLTKIARLPAASRNDFSTGNLKVLINSDVSALCEFYDNLLRNAVPAVVHLLVLTPFAWMLGGWAGVVGMAVACGLLPVAATLAHFAARFEGDVLETKDAVTSHIGEWVRHVRAVRFLSWQDALAGLSYGSAREMMFRE